MFGWVVRFQRPRVCCQKMVRSNTCTSATNYAVCLHSIDTKNLKPNHHRAREREMFESHAKNGNNEPSGSIFTCPTGSSIVLISCKPETPPSLVSSCPGRMPPQHALSIVFSVLRRVVCLRGKCLLLLLFGVCCLILFKKRSLVIKKKRLVSFY